MSTPPSGPGDTLHSFAVSSPADELEDRGGLFALYAQAREGLAARAACGARGEITYHSTAFFGFVNAYAETTCSDLRCAAARTGRPLDQLLSPQQEFDTFADAAKRAVETECADLTPEQRQADAAPPCARWNRPPGPTGTTRSRPRPPITPPNPQPSRKPG